MKRSTPSCLPSKTLVGPSDYKILSHKCLRKIVLECTVIDLQRRGKKADRSNHKGLLGTAWHPVPMERKTFNISHWRTSGDPVRCGPSWVLLEASADTTDHPPILCALRIKP